MKKCWECARSVANSEVRKCKRCNLFEICSKCAEEHEQKCQGKCWRIRLRDAKGEDLSSDAWRRDEVGVWYGAFTASDLQECDKLPAEKALESLNELPRQKTLSRKVKRGDLHKVRRFASISERDWILVYLRAEQALGVAKLAGLLASDKNHPLNTNGECFKYRRLSHKKIFRIAELPDVYRIIPSQGRSNVYLLKETWHLVQLLLRHRALAELNQQLREMPFEQLLDFLGPSGWESFCFAYLILEEGFLPTGLSIGRTLPVVDIVGRRERDGKRIIAQCKKNPHEHKIESEFIDECQPGDIAYYFAYGGCRNGVPEQIRVIDAECATEWARSPRGSRFRQFLLGPLVQPAISPVSY